MPSGPSTTAEQAATRILSAERDLKTQTNKDLDKDAPNPVPGSHEVETFNEPKAETLDRLADEYKAKHGCSLKEAYMEVSKERPELVAAYIK